ncbi:hypothetical protein IscW_ISCW019016 [Ixodes scapularis]|uniref:Uncharacterized protein n=1 Tax=Ixodes scapularis TaxID=6945 RepID=B7PNC3_IXOSC|nr:hypothetical protein IscW_ISCW019016 [Ixodes scapularis]|eukprot:XP_002435286.1 hypothetical protein IscW_ISCW019016 [Ixodes scapularis]
MPCGQRRAELDARRAGSWRSSESVTRHARPRQGLLLRAICHLSTRKGSGHPDLGRCTNVCPEGGGKPAEEASCRPAAWYREQKWSHGSYAHGFPRAEFDEASPTRRRASSPEPKSPALTSGQQQQEQSQGREGGSVGSHGSEPRWSPFARARTTRIRRRHRAPIVGNPGAQARKSEKKTGADVPARVPDCDWCCGGRPVNGGTGGSEASGGGSGVRVGQQPWLPVTRASSRTRPSVRRSSSEAAACARGREAHAWTQDLPPTVEPTPDCNLDWLDLIHTQVLN